MTISARLRILTLLAVTAFVGVLTGCGTGSPAEPTVNVVIGYQSKTINTVTAGTLLRSLGYFERQLDDLGRRTGTKYVVTWQDYDTGAPITAQMIADKIDIGSMGDYPLLINGSRTQAKGENGTRMVSVTGYNLRGALNMVVVAPDSTARTLHDLRGKKISASVGSAGHGTLVQALRRAGIDPNSAVQVENQQPPVGASALQGGNVAALAQFVAWPGDLVFAGQAKLLYDGAELNVPTLHGVVVRNPFSEQHPEVLDAFLRSQLEATRYLHEHPLEAARTVAAATGLPAEVVYLYNGPNGIATFDPTIKPVQREALKGDVPFLASIGNIDDVDVDAFIDDSHLRRVYGPAYDRDAGSTANPSRISGTDQECGRAVDDPATASETWLQDENSTHPAATPTCLLKFVREAQAAGRTVRAGYVPDAGTGTRWFADHAVWVDDPGAPRQNHLLPFATEAGAQEYLRAHPGAVQVSYPAALGAA